MKIVRFGVDVNHEVGFGRLQGLWVYGWFGPVWILNLGSGRDDLDR